MLRRNSAFLSRGRLVAAAVGLAGFAASAPTRAHIVLVSDGGPDTPKDWLVMIDAIGDPQKPTPCGGTGTPTNIVTTFRTGQAVTVSWIEAIAHSGHFRIAFAPVSPAAATAATLPDPLVTAYTDSTHTEASAVAVTPTGGSISSNGIVLADNLFPHCIQGDPCATGIPVTAAPKTYSTTVTLPTKPCTNCTLQIVQFMSYHPVDPSFFYHHCAAVTIVAAEADASGLGVPDGDLGGSDAATPDGPTLADGSPTGSEAAVQNGQASSQGAPRGSTSPGCTLCASGGISGGAACIGGLGVVSMFARRRCRRREAAHAKSLDT